MLVNCSASELVLKYIVGMKNWIRISPHLFAVILLVCNLPSLLLQPGMAIILTSLFTSCLERELAQDDSKEVWAFS